MFSSLQLGLTSGGTSSGYRKVMLGHLLLSVPLWACFGTSKSLHWRSLFLSKQHSLQPLLPVPGKTPVLILCSLEMVMVFHVLLALRHYITIHGFSTLHPHNPFLSELSLDYHNWIFPSVFCWLSEIYTVWFQASHFIGLVTSNVVWEVSSRFHALQL